MSSRHSVPTKSVVCVCHRLLHHHHHHRRRKKPQWSVIPSEQNILPSLPSSSSSSSSCDSTDRGKIVPDDSKKQSQVIGQFSERTFSFFQITFRTSLIDTSPGQCSPFRTYFPFTRSSSVALFRLVTFCLNSYCSSFFCVCCSVHG